MESLLQKEIFSLNNRLFPFSFENSTDDQNKTSNDTHGNSTDPHHWGSSENRVQEVAPYIVGIVVFMFLLCCVGVCCAIRA